MTKLEDAADRLTAAQLEAEALARRVRLDGNLDELSVRMRPANLWTEAKERAWEEVDRVTDNMVSVAEDLVHDSIGWAKDNRGMVLGGAAAALLSAAAVWYSTRRKTVPLYAAYDMEAPEMSDLEDTLSAKATETWSKVKGEAHNLGDKAGEAYYSARHRAAELSDAAREKASEAAEIAREKAHEAAEYAREAAERAREAAGEAGTWAKKQPQENPAMVVIAALAAGALIGALMPHRKPRA
ncbi:DUF3618 domain-containing protein [Sandaracinobacteroides hominis]|uniref:DUF3618 domain-containing protein n=1 Tax=Sandaracinobacteroides hominis TaxID=2780086 RepID=UPI0018F7470A|nr:DUF3618 domain-containing protein [Sandaracinobacteroides hominis]